MLLSRFLKREKPRVFLGSLAIAPQTGLQRYLEDSDALHKTLQNNLQEIFTLPPADDVVSPRGSDLGLDIVVTKFRSGGELGVSLGELGFAMFWRPKVTVASRLYYLSSGKTKVSYAVTETIRWRDYLSRLLSWRTFFGFRPMFDRKEIERLLYGACHKVLLTMKKKI